MTLGLIGLPVVCFGVYAGLKALAPIPQVTLEEDVAGVRLDRNPPKDPKCRIVLRNIGIAPMEIKHVDIVISPKYPLTPVPPFGKFLYRCETSDCIDTTKLRGHHLRNNEVTIATFRPKEMGVDDVLWTSEIKKYFNEGDAVMEIHYKKPWSLWSVTKVRIALSDMDRLPTPNSER